MLWAIKLTFRCVLESLWEGLSVRPSVQPSVRPSVCPSVRLPVRPFVCLSVCPSIRHAFVKTREIDIFEQTIATGSLVGLLEASQHHYMTVHRSIGLSVHRFICNTSVNQIKAKGSQEESQVLRHHAIIPSTWWRVVGLMGLVEWESSLCLPAFSF